MKCHVKRLGRLLCETLRCNMTASMLMGLKSHEAKYNRYLRWWCLTRQLWLWRQDNYAVVCGLLKWALTSTSTHLFKEGNNNMNACKQMPCYEFHNKVDVRIYFLWKFHFCLVNISPLRNISLLLLLCEHVHISATALWTFLCSCFVWTFTTGTAMCALWTNVSLLLLCSFLGYWRTSLTNLFVALVQRHVKRGFEYSNTTQLSTDSKLIFPCFNQH